MNNICGTELLDKALKCFDEYLETNPVIKTCYNNAYGKDGAHIFNITLNSCGKFAMISAYMLTRSKANNDVPRGMDEAYFRYTEERGIEII